MKSYVSLLQREFLLQRNILQIYHGSLLIFSSFETTVCQVSSCCTFLKKCGTKSWVVQPTKDSLVRIMAAPSTPVPKLLCPYYSLFVTSHGAPQSLCSEPLFRWAANNCEYLRKQHILWFSSEFGGVCSRSQMFANSQQTQTEILNMFKTLATRKSQVNVCRQFWQMFANLK